MDDLRPWRCFLAVAEELHFGRAARRLVLPPSTVSQQVRRLEQTLGGALFHRTTRTVRLTDLGARIHGPAATAVAALDAALDAGREAAHDGATPLLLGLAMDIDGGELAAALRTLRRTEPSLTVTLRPMRSADQLHALAEGTLQAGYVWEPPEDDALDSFVVGTTDLAAFVPDDHPVAALASIDLTTLCDHDLVPWTSALNPWTRRRLTGIFADHGLNPLVVAEADGFDAQLPLVLEGRGVGLTAGSVASLRSIPGLTAVPVACPVGFRRCLVWPRRQGHPAIPALVDAVRAAMPSADAAD